MASDADKNQISKRLSEDPFFDTGPGEASGDEAVLDLDDADLEFVEESAEVLASSELPTDFEAEDTDVNRLAPQAHDIHEEGVLEDIDDEEDFDDDFDDDFEEEEDDGYGDNFDGTDDPFDTGDDNDDDLDDEFED